MWSTRRDDPRVCPAIPSWESLELYENFHLDRHTEWQASNTDSRPSVTTVMTEHLRQESASPVSDGRVVGKVIDGVHIYGYL